MKLEGEGGGVIPNLDRVWRKKRKDGKESVNRFVLRSCSEERMKESHS